jgi:hypothetical protein
MVISLALPMVRSLMLRSKRDRDYQNAPRDDFAAGAGSAKSATKLRDTRSPNSEHPDVHATKGSGT